MGCILIADINKTDEFGGVTSGEIIIEVKGNDIVSISWQEKYLKGSIVENLTLTTNKDAFKDVTPNYVDWAEENAWYQYDLNDADCFSTFSYVYTSVRGEDYRSEKVVEELDANSSSIFISLSELPKYN